MDAVAELVERYAAVWNEADAATRRRRITGLWTPEGGTCHRLIDAFGYEAIEGRVTRSYDKWIADKGYRFRPRGKAVGHHGAVKFVWEMVPAGGGAAISVGIDLILLDSDGRIRIAYQFVDPGPSASDEHQAVVERYVDFWNRPSTEKLVALWAEDAAHLSESRECVGHVAIEADAIEAHRDHVAKGFVFASLNDADGHHNVVRFAWDMRPKDGAPVAASGSSLLILGDDGRIRYDYEFND
jgi:SnoaL-like domain